MQQIGAKIFERKLCERDALGFVFEIEDLILEAQQLLVAPFKIGFRSILRIGQNVVFAGCREIDERHARLDPALQIDVMIEIGRRPEIDHLDRIMQATDAVDPTEALDQAHWIPVNVEIDQQIGILKVLALRDAVRGDQQIDFSVLRQPLHGRALLCAGREVGENVLVPRSAQGRSGFATTCH